MALSDHEEQILAEIERGLAAEDPAFYERTRRATSPRTNVSRLRWSIVAFALGMACLFALTFHVLWGVLGVALMLGSVVVGYRAVSALGTGTADELLEKLRKGIGRDTNA